MKYLIIISLLTFSLGMPAQTPVTADESAAMIAAVCKASKVNTLQCDFRQTKQMSMLATSMVSEGRMYVKGGDRLRWEYTVPYTYTFILNKDRIMIKSAGKTNAIDIRTSKMFQQITNIMMSSITGRSLTDERYVQVAMFKTDNRWIAKLTPKQKEMRQMFDQIVLYINPNNHLVNTVELIEKSGDITTIELTTVKKDIPITDETFDVN